MRIRGIQTLRLGEFNPRRMRQNHQRRQKQLPLAHHHALIDPWIRPQRHLQILGQNLLAVGQDDDLVEPPGDVEPAGPVTARASSRPDRRGLPFALAVFILLPAAAVGLYGYLQGPFWQQMEPCTARRIPRRWSIRRESRCSGPSSR